ncbi:MAG: response regulator [Deltaproteobacteria bacterium]|nr:response regulator [Deltaproteobacteria bacterium]
MMGETTESILVVDDDPEVLSALHAELCQQYEVTPVGSAEQALVYLQNKEFDVVISDVRMPGIDGLSLIKQCAIRYPSMVRIILTAFDGCDVHEAALGPHGAYKLVKPWGDDLIITLENALRQRKFLLATRRRLALESEILEFDQRLGPNLDVAEIVHRTATEMTRLPEVIAVAIYRLSDRKTPSLVELVSAHNEAVAPDLLFGRRTPMASRGNYFYSVPIGGWDTFEFALALQLTEATPEITQSLDFVGRQAHRAILVSKAREREAVSGTESRPVRQSRMPSTPSLVPPHWVADTLITPATIVASIADDLTRLSREMRHWANRDSKTSPTLEELHDLYADLMTACSHLSIIMDKLRAQERALLEFAASEPSA